MNRSKWNSALLAVGLSGALAADASVAGAQAPTAPTASADAKVEARPGPLDLVVYFKAGTPEVDTASNTGLDELAVWLKEDRTRTVYIQAHPDEAAAAGFDIKLGGDRTDSARAYLVARGAMDSQIRIVAHGQPHPGKMGANNERTVFVTTLGGEGTITSSGGLSGSAEAGASVSGGAETYDTEPAPAPEPLAPTTVSPVVAPPMTYEGDSDRSDDHLLTPFGMAVSVGGGVIGFIDSDARDLADTGGSWEARLTVGTRSPLAFEAAYVGSAQDIDTLGLDSSAVLVGSSFEGAARLNFTRTAVQPYLFGGLGYTRYDVANADFNTSSVQDEEEMGHIPAGVGLGWQYRGLLLDVRGTVRAAFNDALRRENDSDGEIIPDDDESPGRAELDTWNVAARIGFEF
jgi:hypothetical protein